MSNNVFTLDDLRAEIERQYAPLSFSADGEEFVLRSLLRIGKKDREAILGKLKTLEDTDESTFSEAELVEILKFVLGAVVADGKGPRLLTILGDDLLLLRGLMERWTEATQPGEALPSPA
ncbi:hypothetical protein GCM10012275_39240 [Longimycelium tulufanense]|uniref:Tail assembly chaperone n=1 Tax=Longimycelium tulufanense TaxID=907463 RepID=A0A8J3CI39_9PSEU|nr:phage tail assembly protein [Longimycelium tulufanense]GGM64800.1 hypothetical protein GCM10012275_39240 [Longimycelium tulufanense]